MALSKRQRADIEEVLKTILRSGLQKHNPEPASMPFHTRLLGKDRLALHSFIHSISTSFGGGVFEPVAFALAKNKRRNPAMRATAGDTISAGARREIQDIMNELAAARTSPDKKREIERIRRVCASGEMIKVKPAKVDLFFTSKDGEYFLFDIKTAKPNVGGFKESKRTLLEWVAVLLAKEPEATVNTLIAIPYNPYEPEPYKRWTMRGMLDLRQELKVASDFWDFLGGEGTYKNLLDCFERVGIEMRDEIDARFERFR